MFGCKQATVAVAIAIAANKRVVYTHYTRKCDLLKTQRAPRQIDRIKRNEHIFSVIVNIFFQ